MQARLDPGGSTLPPYIVDATKLRSWMVCPRRFQYGYVEHLTSASNSSSVHTNFGKAAHLGLEILEAGLAAGAALDDALIEAIQRSWPTLPIVEGETKKTHDSLARLLIWYAEQFYAGGQPVYRVVANEQPFCITLIDLVRRGEITEELLEAAGLSGAYYPYLYRVALAGRLDSIVEGPSPDEFWIRERKTTGRYLDAKYFGQYSPDIQISLYSWISKILFPQWKPRGILLEVFQVGVTFCRIERREIKRYREQSQETLLSVLGVVREMAGAGVFDQEGPGLSLPIRESGCNANGMLCAYRRLCNAHPAERKGLKQTEYTIRQPWNPLDGTEAVEPLQQE